MLLVAKVIEVLMEIPGIVNVPLSLLTLTADVQRAPQSVIDLSPTLYEAP